MADAPTQDIISQAISGPWIWILLICIVIYFIIDKFMKNKQRPEEQPFFGMKVREEMTHKKIERRAQIWAIKAKMRLFRGLQDVGEIRNYQVIYRASEHKPDVLEEIYDIGFRKWGVWHWIMYHLLRRYEHLMIDPKAFAVDNSKKCFVIDPRAYFFEDSGIWALATRKETRLVDDVNLKVDLENIKGYVSDHPRRLSNIHPSASITGEQKTLDAQLKEQERRNRISSWEKGG